MYSLPTAHLTISTSIVQQRVIIPSISVHTYNMAYTCVPHPALCHHRRVTLSIRPQNRNDRCPETVSSVSRLVNISIHLGLNALLVIKQVVRVGGDIYFVPCKSVCFCKEKQKWYSFYHLDIIQNTMGALSQCDTSHSRFCLVDDTTLVDVDSFHSPAVSPNLADIWWLTPYQGQFVKQISCTMLFMHKTRGSKNIIQLNILFFFNFRVCASHHFHIIGRPCFMLLK